MCLGRNPLVGSNPTSSAANEIRMEMTNEELIEKARSIVKPKKMRHGFTTADCACVLVTEKGNVYLGVSIDTSSSMGFCAERSALAAMVTNQEFKIKKIVAVLEDGTVLSPCGVCREFMYQIDRDNLDADVIVEKDKVVKLKDLLPFPWDESL
ncbi:MAG: cytidine deaminase [Parcubacteria group bacterium Greene0714_21]|nr:MAG: cytidine deaminase [Parcubacteria group bacterium Greene0416_39]TSD04079.1 MAG: cytidine deaminase [Parcubacteria group bacterium Greene0714_21]